MATAELYLDDLRGNEPWAVLEVPLVWAGASWVRDSALREAAHSSSSQLPERTDWPYGTMPPSWFGADKPGDLSTRFPLLSRARQYDSVEFLPSEIMAVREEIVDLEQYLLDEDVLPWRALAAVLLATESLSGRQLVLNDL